MEHRPTPHLTPDELDGLVRDGAIDARRETHARECPTCAELVREAARVRTTLIGTGVSAASAALTTDCREPAEIAVLVAESGEAAKEFLAHAVSCDHCGPLIEAALSETPERDEDRALLADLHTARPEWRRQMAFRLAAAGRRQPAGKKRWIAATVGLLAAAALVALAVRIARSPVDRPELQELVTAVASVPQRPVEGRLTGGFRYAPPPTLLRGPAGDAAPRIRIAAARLEETQRANDTAATQAAVGVGFLAVGELDKAVDALEDAVGQLPSEARYQSDLAAAYLARAKWMDRAEDWPKALAAAERAVKADAALVEAHFNRALALEGLHLAEEAIDAWTAYQSLDPSSQWSAEAANHAAKLREALAAPRRKSNQDLRERIEDQLLMKWGEAVLAGDTVTSARLLDEAESAAAELVEAGGDTMARDEIVLIRHAVGKNGEHTALAKGHVWYGQARKHFLSERLGDATDHMIRASSSFAVAQSPYQYWGPIYLAMRLWVGGSIADAREKLLSLSLSDSPPTYRHLRGRYHWTKGVVLGMSGRFDLARADWAAAIDAFGRTGELENLSAALVGAAEADWIIGAVDKMWEHELRALSNLPVLPFGLRRSAVLRGAALFALSDGLPEAALQFQNALVRSVHAGTQTAARPDAHVRRARILFQMGDPHGAAADLDQAEGLISDVSDPGLRDRNIAEVNRARAELLPSVDSEAAMRASELALDYFRRAGPVNRLAEGFARRAQIREVRGDVDGASGDYQRAADAFDADRRTLILPQDRMQAFDQHRNTFKSWIRLEAVVRGNPEEALRIAERARTSGSLERSAGIATPLDPSDAHRQLGGGVAVVYYVTLEDRVLVWVFTRTTLAHFSRPFSLAKLRATVRTIRNQIDRGATVATIVPATRALFSELIEPALSHIPAGAAIVFIPDDHLSMIPFGAIPDRQGHPLVAARAIAMAPSFSNLLSASAGLSGFSAADVLAIGDGQDPSTTGMPRLHLADEEAALVGRLYPQSRVLTGRQATKTHLLAADSAVIHFSGHTVANVAFPMFSQMLLAAVPDKNETGALFGHEIAVHKFKTTKVVVLATCNGASGRAIEGEGVISVARMFLAAGVSSVVASLWPVDEAAHSMIVTFHRELIAHGEPARALQASQLGFLRERGLDVPVRVWGGFIALGAVTSTLH